MSLSLEYGERLRELETPGHSPRTSLDLRMSSLHIEPSWLPRDKTTLFLLHFPQYRRTLRLALFHEELSAGNRFYKGWQWHDVETHPRELSRLVTEEISMVNLRTKHATYYLLRDREAVKDALRTTAGQTVPATLQTPY